MSLTDLHNDEQTRPSTVHDTARYEDVVARGEAAIGALIEQTARLAAEQRGLNFEVLRRADQKTLARQAAAEVQAFITTPDADSWFVQYCREVARGGHQ